MSLNAPKNCGRSVRTSDRRQCSRSLSSRPDNRKINHARTICLFPNGFWSVFTCNVSFFDWDDSVLWAFAARGFGGVVACTTVGA
jgi:hypothetical protein